MTPEPTPPKPPDVGVLFVHGMGEQKRADTLVQFGEALQRWLERWLPATDGRPSVRFTRAELSQTMDSKPARAELRITTPSGESTWILAESWWAESFRAPTYSDLWRWSIEVVPVAVAEHFVRKYRLAPNWYRKAAAVMIAGLATTLLPLLTIVMITSLVIGVLPIPRLRTAILRLQKILLATVGDSYALLESSIRDAAMRFCVERDLRWLQTVTPKTVVVAHSQGAAVTHAALQVSNVRPNLLLTFGSGLRKLLVLDVIRGSDRFIVWLPPLGLFLMAIGSWLGYRLVVDPTLRVNIMPLQTEFIRWVNHWIGFDIFGWRVFLTLSALVGAAAGIAQWKDSLLERVALAGLSAVLVMAFASFLKAVMVAGPPGYAAFFCVTGGGSLLVRGFRVLEGDTYTRIDRRLELDPPVSWVDVYADSDPVPNGPLAGPGAAFLGSERVSNLASILRDHSNYWLNTDQFVSFVAIGVGAMAGIDLTATHEWDAQRLRRAGARRRWRVGWLRVIRYAAVAVLVLLGTRYLQGPWRRPGDLPPLLHVLFVESVDLFEKIPFIKLLVTEATTSAVVLMLWPAWLCFAAWLIYRVFLIAWSWWDRDDINVLFDRKDYAFCSVPFLALLSVVGVVLAVSMALAGHVDRELIVWWTRDPWIATLRANFWSTLFQPFPQGPGLVIPIALFASGLAAGSTMSAADQWSWGRSRENDAMEYVRWIARGVPSFAVAAPAGWFLFNLGGDPPAPPYPALVSSWGGIGAMLVLFGLAFLPNILLQVGLASSFGRRVVDWLRGSSVSGAIGVWIARAESSEMPDASSLLARRAEQMLDEWKALEPKQRTLSVTADYNREAVAIVSSRAAFLSDPDRVVAITETFPYAAVAAVETVALDAPVLARRILDPHRRTAPAAVRWRIRRIEKRLGRMNTEAQTA